MISKILLALSIGLFITSGVTLITGDYLGAAVIALVALVIQDRWLKERKK